MFLQNYAGILVCLANIAGYGIIEDLYGGNCNESGRGYIQRCA
jgi:hypothetical protein